MKGVGCEGQKRPFHPQTTVGGTVSQSVGRPENGLHSACDCGLRREELLNSYLSSSIGQDRLMGLQ